MSFSPTCFGPLAVVGLVVGTVAVALGAISLAKKLGGRSMAISGIVTGSIGVVVPLVTLPLFFHLRRPTAVPGPPARAVAVATTAPASSGPAQFNGMDETPVPGLAPVEEDGRRKR